MNWRLENYKTLEPTTDFSYDVPDEAGQGFLDNVIVNYLFG